MDRQATDCAWIKYVIRPIRLGRVPAINLFPQFPHGTQTVSYYMLSIKLRLPNLRTHCILQRPWHLQLSPNLQNGSRPFSQSVARHNQQLSNDPIKDDTPAEKKELGAMSRRLEEMTERTVGQGGRSAQKAVEEAGFSEELKHKLEARIADSKFKAENQAAFAQINLPVCLSGVSSIFRPLILRSQSSAGKGTRDIAAAQPWTGTEKLEDSALRMLSDAHKPLRTGRPRKIPSPRGVPGNVDLRMRKAVERTSGERLANARDKTSIYAMSQDSTMTEREREQMRKQLKERFTAGARPMPASIQGLAALANERIEDAIARGQFKNIPRGKGTNIERDYTASSPFLDTTEYFMNKIIQKQDIVPPWIEKQQELVKSAATFRNRLRADWKRHAARMIASKGGSLEAQVRRAEAYAAAEAAYNPKAVKLESFTEIDAEEKLAQLTITETQASPYAAGESKISVTEAPLVPPTTKESKDTAVASPSVDDLSTSLPPPETKDEHTSTSTPIPVSPFRDPDWEKLELPYHTLALNSLNNLTRSYNLMAPDLAKKPYFSLQRELKSCFADIAFQLPAEIRERAKAPARIKVELVGHRPGGVLERFATDKAKVYDSKRPNYGFKEFWKDLWGGSKERTV